MSEYAVVFVHEDRAGWATTIERAVRERLRAHGLQHIDIEFGTTLPGQSRVILGLYLGSRAGAVSALCSDVIRRAMSLSVLVVPVVDDLREFRAETPEVLHAINAWLWRGDAAVELLAHWILEQLGLEERQRKVFVSHRREDSILMAERLHDELAKRRFYPFVDRFDVQQGADTQDRIKEALDDVAFLLLIESPNAYRSDWVFYEVEYALSHYMGLFIVRWPDTTVDIPATEGLPRQQLQPQDLATVSDQVVLTDGAMETVLLAVERAHAAALRRRRRNLVVSVKEAAEAQGLVAFEQPGDRVLVRGADSATLVGITPRLPRVDDLYQLDKVRTSLISGEAAGVMVHSASQLPSELFSLLDWSIGSRNLTLLPQNAVGAYWRPVRG